MTEIRFKGSRFGVEYNDLWILCRRISSFGAHAKLVLDEPAAFQWLGDHALPARNARRLLDAELRGTGPYADAQHNLRT